MRDFYEPPETASPEEQEGAKNRKYLVEWCLHEDIPQGELARIVRRSKVLTRSYKRVLDLQELRLAKQGESAKNPAFSIFALKNKAGWRDDPDAAKAKSQNKLTLQLMLPPKQDQHGNKSLAGIATAQVIEDKPVKPQALKSKRFQVNELPPKSEKPLERKAHKKQEKPPEKVEKPVSIDSVSDNDDKPAWLSPE